jgi:hypothetical protein
MNSSIKVAVACRDANGSPDIVVVVVDASSKDVFEGNHYEKAKATVAEQGFEALLAFDTKDPAWKRLSKAVTNIDSNSFFAELAAELSGVTFTKVGGTWSWDLDDKGSSGYETKGEAAQEAVQKIYPKAAWRQEVCSDSTQLGYFEWTLNQAEEMTND